MPLARTCLATLFRKSLPMVSGMSVRMMFLIAVLGLDFEHTIVEAAEGDDGFGPGAAQQRLQLMGRVGGVRVDDDRARLEHTKIGDHCCGMLGSMMETRLPLPTPSSANAAAKRSLWRSSSA